MNESCHTYECVTGIDLNGWAGCELWVRRQVKFFAACCSVLQCVAVWCSVVQCGAACCSVLQCVAVCCSVVQCGAQCDVACCSVLQCVAHAYTFTLLWP